MNLLDTTPIDIGLPQYFVKLSETIIGRQPFGVADYVLGVSVCPCVIDKQD